MKRPDYAQWFYFTRRERRAILLLITTIIILRVAVPNMVNFMEFDTDLTEFKDEVRQYMSSLENSEPLPISIPSFDVNTIDAHSLVQYGLDPQVAKTWIKYRDAKGAFASVEDVQKIFRIDQNWVETNRSKMIFPNNKRVPEKGTVVQKKQQFEFDPNTASADSLRALGFSKLAIASIMGFRQKGGIFRQVEDLSIIYGVQDELITRLADFVLIDSVFREKAVFEPTIKTVAESEDYQIDINVANVFQWQMLNGIGPTLARRIVKFREGLGGFYAIDQVGETYGLPDSTFKSIQESLELSQPYLKMRVNSMVADSLKLHPYFNWKQSNILINFRDQRQGIDSIEELYEIRVFDSAFIRRAAPYLDFAPESVLQQ
ncbi:MAG: hypothetical protein HKN87_24520 [Saprospiraceae bacterium]|nr:hypothetical protein [Saprospiraceae bacterium]